MPDVGRRFVDMHPERPLQQAGEENHVRREEQVDAEPLAGVDRPSRQGLGDDHRQRSALQLRADRPRRQRDGEQKAKELDHRRAVGAHHRGDKLVRDVRPQELHAVRMDREKAKQHVKRAHRQPGDPKAAAHRFGESQYGGSPKAGQRIGERYFGSAKGSGRRGNSGGHNAD